MRTSDLSAYARGAMTFDEKRRLAFHVSSLKLHAAGAHDGPSATFRAWLVDRHGTVVAVREDIPRIRLFAAICDLLVSAGEPLPTDDEWATIAQVLA